MYLAVLAASAVAVPWLSPWLVSSYTETSVQQERVSSLSLQVDDAQNTIYRLQAEASRGNPDEYTAAISAALAAQMDLQTQLSVAIARNNDAIDANGALISTSATTAPESASEALAKTASEAPSKTASEAQATTASEAQATTAIALGYRTTTALALEHRTTTLSRVSTATTTLQHSAAQVFATRVPNLLSHISNRADSKPAIALWVLIASVGNLAVQ